MLVAVGLREYPITALISSTLTMILGALGAFFISPIRDIFSGHIPEAASLS
jgi:hypothetical protein